MEKKNRLKELRLSKKLSQKEIGTQLKISQVAYNKIENGKTNLRPKYIDKLTEFYGVSPQYLKGESEFRTVQLERQYNREMKELPNITRSKTLDLLRILGFSFQDYFIIAGIKYIQTKDDVYTNSEGKEYSHDEIIRLVEKNKNFNSIHNIILYYHEMKKEMRYYSFVTYLDSLISLNDKFMYGILDSIVEK